MRILLATLLVLAAIPAAHGSIIMFSGVTVLPSAPASDQIGALTSDTTIYAFAEKQGATLPVGLTVGIARPGQFTCCDPSTIGGKLPAGDVLNSYILHDQPITGLPGRSDRVFDGSITFSADEQVVGVIVTYQGLGATDIIFGAPGTVYSSNDPLRGLDSTGRDVITLSQDRHTITVSFDTSLGNIDEIRILTTVPEPGALLLFGSGLLGLGLWKRRQIFTRR
ncbi:MAG: PEP-CTERM sorting domain-containing protein [Bryobacteraceae bacterium]